MNMKKLDLYKEAKVSQIDKQIFMIDKMVSNKLSLVQSPFYDPEML